ncbi:MAG TPA: YciI family protein [Candidatus Limnocylindria bacterium]|nr:YciI family protein [Candidatus Limnocylindria bacterium]
MAKFILLFAGDDDVEARLPKAESDEVYKRIGEWFATHGQAGKIVGGEELQPRNTAKTVRFDRGGKPTVTDGPYMEAKELVGGYAIVEAADLNEAIELAKGWPGRSSVEVRPLVDHSGGATA